MGARRGPSPPHGHLAPPRLLEQVGSQPSAVRCVVMCSFQRQGAPPPPPPSLLLPLLPSTSLFSGLTPRVRGRAPCFGLAPSATLWSRTRISVARGMVVRHR